MMNWQKNEIVLCNDCEGKGYKVHHELVNYHKGEYDTTNESCKTCEGSGRLEKNTVITFTPYRKVGREA